MVIGITWKSMDPSSKIFPVLGINHSAFHRCYVRIPHFVLTFVLHAAFQYYMKCVKSQIQFQKVTKSGFEKMFKLWHF